MAAILHKVESSKSNYMLFVYRTPVLCEETLYYVITIISSVAKMHNILQKYFMNN